MMHKAEPSCKNVCKYINIHKQLWRRHDRYVFFMLKWLFFVPHGCYLKTGQAARSKAVYMCVFVCKIHSSSPSGSQLRKLHEVLQNPT